MPMHVVSSDLTLNIMKFQKAIHLYYRVITPGSTANDCTAKEPAQAQACNFKLDYTPIMKFFSCQHHHSPHHPPLIHDQDT